MVSNKPSGKSDQLTLASGGSEYAWLLSVAVSWSNKTNFSLCASHSNNYATYCSDIHNTHTAVIQHQYHNG